VSPDVPGAKESLMLRWLQSCSIFLLVLALAGCGGGGGGAGSPGAMVGENRIDVAVAGLLSA
jgi:hypothetical protein